MAITPRTKTLYVFGESATKELERANTEIKKNTYRFKGASEKLSFGKSGADGRNKQSLKNHLIQSMRQEGSSAQPKVMKPKGIPSVAGKPPAGPPVVRKNKKWVISRRCLVLMRIVSSRVLLYS